MGDVVHLNFPTEHVSNLFSSTCHSFCLGHLYAYQTMSAGAISFDISISIIHADGCAAVSANAAIWMMTKIVPMMMFVQRFALSFKVSVRTAITSGARNRIANSSMSSGVIFMPSISPDITCSNAPDSKPASVM